MDDFQLAYADCLILFPTLASLGDGDPPAKWFEQYNHVKNCGALTATLIVGNTSGDGSSANAVRNFPQKILLAALHARRAALDSDYLEAVQTPPPNLAREAGIVLRLGC